MPPLINLGECINRLTQEIWVTNSNTRKITKNYEWLMTRLRTTSIHKLLFCKSSETSVTPLEPTKLMTINSLRTTSIHKFLFCKSSETLVTPLEPTNSTTSNFGGVDRHQFGRFWQSLWSRRVTSYPWPRWRDWERNGAIELTPDRCHVEA
jgi:hypothetical protein